MMLTADNLYALLPAVYRERDAALGINGGPGPLRELIEIVADQLGLVDAEIDQLYDDAFIETCAQWVVPYIGDLVSYTPLNANVSSALSPRAEVANTIRYRRWKGTVTILEQLASDVTGWSARAVEFFTLLSTTQFMNHLRLQSLGTADIRHYAVASTAGTPFDGNCHAVEVRRIRSKRGRFNIPNVGVYVWRLGAFANPDDASNAFRIGDGLYTFDPLGDDRALVNVPQAKKNPFTRTTPADVPAPLGVRAVADAGPPFVFSVYDGTGVRIPDIHVDICDLSAWTTPAGTPNPPPPYVVAVDPALGRIWFPPGTIPAPHPILVTYGYAFSGPYGAGFYERTLSGSATLSVTRDPATLQPNMTMTGAINTALGGSTTAIVEYADNVTDSSAATVVSISAGENVTVRAADRRRPVFLGSLTVSANVASGQSGTLVLEGFLFGAGVIVTGTGTLELVIRNCTICSDKNDNDGVAWSGASGTLTLEHTLCTAIVLPTADVDASISDFDRRRRRGRGAHGRQRLDRALHGVRVGNHARGGVDRERDHHRHGREHTHPERLRPLLLSAAQFDGAAALSLPARRRRAGRDGRGRNRRSDADRDAAHGDRRPRGRAGRAAIHRRRRRRSGLRTAFGLVPAADRRRRRRRRRNGRVPRHVHRDPRSQSALSPRRKSSNVLGSGGPPCQLICAFRPDASISAARRSIRPSTGAAWSACKAA